MSRRRLVALLVGLGVVVAGVAVVLVLLRNDTTTVIDANRARAVATTTTSQPTIAGSSTTAAFNPVPAGGDDVVVYAYELSGFEAVDALAGARHDYPAATYLTVQSGGCGELWRWQAIEERWSSWEVCDPQHVTVAGFDSFNRWFGVADLQQYRCDDPAPYLPPAADVETWTFACSTENITQATTAEVVGTETLDVGGIPVETIHIHYTDTLSGDSTGGSETDRWFRLDEPLVVREVGSTASASPSPIGTVNYTEEYGISLQSLDPLSL